MPQLERCSKGAKFVSGGGQNFCVGLLFFDFSFDLKKKKGHLAKLFYLSPSFLSVSKKKKHPLNTAARERGVWVGMVGILGGRNFCLGAPPPFAHP